MAYENACFAFGSRRSRQAFTTSLRLASPNRALRQTSGVGTHTGIPYTLLHMAIGHGTPVRTHMPIGAPLHSSSKRVKGRSRTVEKRKAIHPQKPHATSQPSRIPHTPRLSTDAAHN